MIFNLDFIQLVLVQYLFSAINNSTNARTFSIDKNGNAYFAGELSAATGTFSGTLSGNYISGAYIDGGTISGTLITGG